MADRHANSPAVDVDAMDWGPGGIEMGTQEADEATTALVSAAVVLNGASAGPSTETAAQQLWRCGELRMRKQHLALWVLYVQARTEPPSPR